jgi:hypothetical protein
MHAELRSQNGLLNKIARYALYLSDKILLKIILIPM